MTRPRCVATTTKKKKKKRLAQPPRGGRLTAPVSLARQRSRRNKKKGENVCKVWSGGVSDAQHVAKHVCDKGFCIRCDLHKHRALYEMSARGDGYGGPTWLATGFSNGKWGLGCRECAAAKHLGLMSATGRYSKWADFRIRPKTGYTARWLIRQHRRSENHATACRPHRSRKRKRTGALADGNVAAEPRRRLPLALRPLGDSASGVSPRADDDQDAALLKGNVPTPGEWRDAWASLSETSSLRKLARMKVKERGASTTEGRLFESEGRILKRRRKQLRVMAEVQREMMRQVLRQASSISPSSISSSPSSRPTALCLC